MPSDTLKQEASDKLVPDPDVCREFNITAMTLWRWDRDVNLEFPPPVKIRNRNFRSRRLLELFKNQLIQKSLKERDARRGKA
jgi:predicted DNA-binding transcriptional regulator AlpA